MKTQIKQTSSFPPGGVKLGVTADSPKAPPEKCHICEGTEFWLRDNGYGPSGWLCSKCHPIPFGLEVVVSGGD